jgi:hypothetical protein
MRLLPLVVLMLVLASGCARYTAFAAGFNRGLQSASASSPHRQTCRPSPYAKGETICEDD